MKCSNSLFPQNSLTAWSHWGLLDLVQSGEPQVPSEGGFGSNWGVLPVKRNSVYKELWRKVIDLMGLGSHVNVTFQLVYSGYFGNMQTSGTNCFLYTFL